MEILKEMVHANVTPLYEIIDDPNCDKIFLVMQYLNQGSLEDCLNEAIRSNVAIS
jgi:serine/threonine protein kinase